MIKPRLHDVAKEAGVSIATASLALNGKGRISAGVKRKVLDAAKKLGYKNRLYVPYTLQHKIRPVGLLLYEDQLKSFEWHFVRRIISHIEEELVKEHYYPVFIPVKYDSDARYLLTEILTAKVKGLFSVHYSNFELFSRLEELGVPVVLVNNSNFQSTFYTVCTDDFQASYEGTLHLLELGHRNIAYIKYSLPDISTFISDSTIGFKKALDEYHVELPDENILHVNLYDRVEMKKKVHTLMRINHAVSAIFALDDYLAAQIIAILHALSISIPQDMSIIAAGDTLNYDDLYVPKITTMRVDVDALGSYSGNLMLKRFSKKSKGIEVIKIKQQLINRGSCIQAR
jgi:LacI family transcriptional regulator